MRLAVVADIHGNRDALYAVLADLARRDVDTIVNLGDVASGPLYPAETVAQLMALDWPTVRGNHDRNVGTAPPVSLGASDRYAYATLSPAQRAWLAALPPTIAPVNGVLACHGTPVRDDTYLLERPGLGSVCLVTSQQLAIQLRDVDARLILCGHSHLPSARRLGDGRLVLNPGSVGLPAYEADHPWPHVIETGVPYARYAIATFRHRQWVTDQIAVRYDWEAAAALAASRGRSDWAMALRTGRVRDVTDRKPACQQRPCEGGAPTHSGTHARVLALRPPGHPRDESEQEKRHE